MSSRDLRLYIYIYIYTRIFLGVLYTMKISVFGSHYSCKLYFLNTFSFGVSVFWFECMEYCINLLGVLVQALQVLEQVECLPWILRSKLSHKCFAGLTSKLRASHSVSFTLQICVLAIIWTLSTIKERNTREPVMTSLSKTCFMYLWLERLSWNITRSSLQSYELPCHIKTEPPLNETFPWCWKENMQFSCHLIFNVYR